MRLALCLVAGLPLLSPVAIGRVADDARYVVAIRDSSFALPDSVQAMLSQVVDLRVAPDLSVYVSDQQLPFVLHLDRSGGLRRTVGRAGNGPGEFLRPGFMGWKGDSLWVYDFGLVRLTLFDTAGAGPSTFSLLQAAHPSAASRGPVGFATMPTALLPDGDLLVYGAPRNEVTGEVTEASVLRVTRRIEVRDTVAELKLSHSRMAFVFRDGARFLVQPFGDDPLVSFDSDGRWFLRVDRPAAGGGGEPTFTVTLMERASRLVYRREFTYAPLPLRSDTVEAYLRSVLAWDPGPGHMRLALTRDSLLRELYQPRFYPPVADARVARDGTVWLRVMDASSGNLVRKGQAQWVALSPRGFEMWRILVPSALRVYDVDRTSLWGVELAPDWVPQLGRYVMRGQAI